MYETCAICANMRCLHRLGCCRGCYYRLGAKGRAKRRAQLYPPAICAKAANYMRRGSAHDYAGPSHAAEPTPHLRPAEPDMILVMQARVRAGQSVRVRGDGTLDGWAPTTEEAAAVLGGCRKRRG